MSTHKTTGNYVIQARMRVRAGMQSAFVRHLLAQVSIARAQPGVQQFEFYRDCDDVRHFMLYEVFDDRAAWEGLHALPGGDASRVATAPLVEERDRTEWTTLESFPESSSPSTTTAQVAVTRSYHVLPGMADEMIAESVADAARASGKLIRFDVNRDPLDPLHFMICGRWPDVATLEAHQDHQEHLAMRERTKNGYGGPVTRFLWSPATSDS